MPNQPAASAEVKAATSVQSTYRGFKARSQAKQKLLFETWAKLDLKEESELRGDVDMNNQLLERLDSFEKKNNLDSLPMLTRESTIDLQSFSSAVLKKLETIESDRKSEAESKTASLVQEDGQEGQRTTTVPMLRDNEELTLQWVTEMMDAFHLGHTLQESNIFQILKRVVPILSAEPNIQDAIVPEHGRLTMVGDIHGQLDDLFSILKLNGLPNAESPYLFNGDWVDRGPNSCEVICTIFAFKVLYPNSVYLNRGNHEARDINTRDGFQKEVLAKYDATMFDAFEKTFSFLPLATIIEKEVFVVHAGLFYDDMTLPEIRGFDRFHEVPPPETLMEDMLWSDPCPQNGKYDNSRGCALEFGPDVVDKFLTDNDLKKIMRSHECVNEGYEEWFGGKLVTVFSASNYTGTVGNHGAFAIFRKHDVLNPTFVQFMAQKAHTMKRINMRHGLLAEDIVIKLLMRITANRLGLINHYMGIAVGDSNIITRKQWAEGLSKVLGLLIPFNHFEEYLGLPDLGVDGTPGGPVDFMSFLHRFKPTHTQLSNDTYAHNADVNQAFHDISQIIFSKRFALESVFRFFDVNGDGCITADEFAEGVRGLTAVFGRDYSKDVLNEMVTRIDVNGDGKIEYDEFFQCFQTLDPSLLSSERLLNATQSVKVAEKVHYKRDSVLEREKKSLLEDDDEEEV